MKTLSIDIETYSDVQLPKTSVYRYCESDNFEILLFAYSVDSQPVQVVDLACGETIPEEIIAALEDDTVIKWAFNAAFERICLSRLLGYPTGTYLNPESWRCSMIWAATMGLPLSLEGVGAVLGLEKQKLTEGKDLIKYFCQPCAATKANGGRTRNRPFHAPDKWEAFKRYNIRDVETEMGLMMRVFQPSVVANGHQPVLEAFLLMRNTPAMLFSRKLILMIPSTGIQTKVSSICIMSLTTMKRLSAKRILKLQDF